MAIRRCGMVQDTVGYCGVGKAVSGLYGWGFAKELYIYVTAVTGTRTTTGRGDSGALGKPAPNGEESCDHKRVTALSWDQ